MSAALNAKPSFLKPVMIQDAFLELEMDSTVSVATLSNSTVYDIRRYVMSTLSFRRYVV